MPHPRVRRDRQGREGPCREAGGKGGRGTAGATPCPPSPRRKSVLAHRGTADQHRTQPEHWLVSGLQHHRILFCLEARQGRGGLWCGHQQRGKHSCRPSPQRHSGLLHVCTSVAHKATGTVLSRRMRHKDASGQATNKWGSSDAAVRRRPPPGSSPPAPPPPTHTHLRGPSHPPPHPPPLWRFDNIPRHVLQTTTGHTQGGSQGRATRITA